MEGSYRIRYETLDHPFRAGTSGSDQILAERLLLFVRFEGRNFYAGAELEDSRVQVDDRGTPLGTDDVNAGELLRAFVGFRSQNLLRRGDRFDVQIGRITLGMGSRRLSARNRFRNTINGFTGLHATWTSPKGTRLQAFFTLPVNRKPSEFDRLARNDIELDHESLDVRFWGLHAARERFIGPVAVEADLFVLNESDSPRNPTRNRDLVTPGFRLHLPPSSGGWDFEVEAALQTGASRESANSAQLDHRAGFTHLQVGYTLDRPGSPHLEFLYDYAGGDVRPDDGENNRFDTLFGARRFEFGPTGIYGAFARSNISTPGLRFTVKPDPRVDFFLGYRPVFLASRRDAWTTSGLRDGTGSSGRFVGQQLEGRIRFSQSKGVLRLEAGGAWLIPGAFLKRVAGAPGEGDPVYFYTQVSFSF